MIEIKYLRQRYKRFIMYMYNDDRKYYCPNPGLMSDLCIIGSRCLVSNNRVIAIEKEPQNFTCNNSELYNLIENAIKIEDIGLLSDKYVKLFENFSDLYVKYDIDFSENIKPKKREKSWRYLERFRRTILNRKVIENTENLWVGIDTQLSNKLALNHLSQISDEVFLPEKTIGNCRFDYVSDNSIIEVKFCHWKSEGNTISFPDCITDRGTKQLKTLANRNSYLIFIAQRSDAEYFSIGERDLQYYNLSHNIKKLAFAYDIYFNGLEVKYLYKKQLIIK